MSTPYDSDALLASVRRRARAPSTTAPGWTDASLLLAINEEVTSKLGPDIVRLRREWLVASRDVTMTAGTATYGLWTRTVMASVRDVGVVIDGVFRSLDELDPEDFDGKDPTQSDTPTHYTVRGTDLVLWPTPNSGDTLRISYFRRLNRIVATSAVGTITSLGTNNTVLNCSGGVPSTISTSTPVDIVRASPFFDSLAIDQTPSGKTSTSVTLSTAPTGVAVGDYVCLAGESPVLQLPPECFALLAQRVANALMRPGRDAQALADGRQELAELEASVFGVAEDRNVGGLNALSETVWQ